MPASPAVFLLFTLVQHALALQAAKQKRPTVGFHPPSPIWPCTGLECVRKYIALADDHYSWQDTGILLSGVDPSTSVSWTGHVLNMTSQKWLSTDEVEYPIQWHTMVVVIPGNLETSQPGDGWANLVLDFGLNSRTSLGLSRAGTPMNMEIILNRLEGSDASALEMVPGNTALHPEKPGPFEISNDTILQFKGELQEAASKAAYLATHTQSVSISLYSTINGVQIFKDDAKRRELADNDLTVYSWSEFMKHGGDEPERIIELPAAKAVVRAMDTATAFTAGLKSGMVTRFAVTGYSKLGRVAWAVSAVDERVTAIAPVAESPRDWSDFERPVVSLIDQSLHTNDIIADLQADSSSVFAEFGFLEQFSPKLALRRQQITDPGHWLDQIKTPVLYIQDTNDQYFDQQLGLVDSWLHALAGPAHVLIVNATHDTALLTGLSAIAAFFQGQRIGEDLPTVSYEVDSINHSLTVTQERNEVVGMPSSVRLFSASTCASEPGPSFLDSAWSESPLASQVEGMWAADIKAAQSGSEHFGAGCFEGAFAQLQYPGPKPGYDAYQISTPVVILPK